MHWGAGGNLLIARIQSELSALLRLDEVPGEEVFKSEEKYIRRGVPSVWACWASGSKSAHVCCVDVVLALSFSLQPGCGL